jgi:hypothetical protein
VTAPDQRHGATPFRGSVSLDYAPQADSEPDPGEVVWAWVPYEEDRSRGKDRPLLVVGRPAGREGREGYVALMLSSRDRGGEYGWVRLGTGSWDRANRVSWVKVDRMLLVHDGGIRREGAVVGREDFLAVLDKVVREQRGEQVD